MNEDQKKNSKVPFVMTIVVAIVILIAGAFAYSFFQRQQPAKNDDKSQNITNSNTASDVKQYKSDLYPVMFSYPQNWKVVEYASLDTVAACSDSGPTGDDALKGTCVIVQNISQDSFTKDLAAFEKQPDQAIHNKSFLVYKQKAVQSGQQSLFYLPEEGKNIVINVKGETASFTKHQEIIDNVMITAAVNTEAVTYTKSDATRGGLEFIDGATDNQVLSFVYPKGWFVTTGSDSKKVTIAQLDQKLAEEPSGYIIKLEKSSEAASIPTKYFDDTFVKDSQQDFSVGLKLGTKTKVHAGNGSGREDEIYYSFKLDDASYINVSVIAAQSISNGEEIADYFVKKLPQL